MTGSSSLSSPSPRSRRRSPLRPRSRGTDQVDIPPVPPLPSLLPSRPSSPHTPFGLASEQLHALYRHHNVLPIKFVPGAHLLEFIQLIVVRDAHLPTHVLALLDPSANDSPVYTPVLAPLHAGPFVQDFANLTLPQTHLAPTPYRLQSGEWAIALPVVPVIVPHPSSVPLLLLFALRLEKEVNLLAYSLLPPLVIAEFPDAATMSRHLARCSTDDEFSQCLVWNHGLWKNTLALGYEGTTIVTMIQTVWNVTAEARRIRQSI